MEQVRKLLIRLLSLSKGNYKMKEVRIHRFGDYVSVSIGNGQTVNISKEQATTIANSMLRCSKEIKTTKYANSQFKSLCIELKA